MAVVGTSRTGPGGPARAPSTEEDPAPPVLGSDVTDSDVPGSEVPDSDVPGSAAASIAPLAVVVGALFALIAARPLADNSLLTHLATGRLILGSGLPVENPFLYTSTDFPVPSWWWSVVLAAADRVGGAGAIRLLSAVTAAVLGALLVQLAARGAAPSTMPGARPGEPPRTGPDARPGAEPERDGAQRGLLAVVVPVALAAVCVLPFLNGRPHLGGFVLLALALVLRAERRSPWWMVAIFAVWVNLHGTWAYGLAVLGAFAVASAIDERRIRREDLRTVFAAAIGLVAGAALYPDRFALLVLPLRQFGDPLEREALRAYAEWSPVTPDMAGFWMLIALGVCALAGALRHRRWGNVLLALGLTVLGFSASRVMPIAAISLIPLASVGLTGRGSLALPRGAAARVTTGCGVVLGGVAVVFALSAPGYDLDRYPVDAVDWLEERDLVANGTNVVSHDYVGNYLGWRYGSGAHAYVDDRPSAPTLIDYRALMLLEEGWQDALDRARPDVVLWLRDDPLSNELGEDPGWFDAGDAGGFAVFCRAELADRCS